jgi:hypothetical protein
MLKDISNCFMYSQGDYKETHWMVLGPSKHAFFSLFKMEKWLSLFDIYCPIEDMYIVSFAPLSLDDVWMF